MNIIIDTREQQPWSFKFYGCKDINQQLKYGDYSIEYHQDIVLIERKKSLAELTINFGKKRTQFFKELTELAKVPHPYLICEFPQEYIETFPENSGIPKKMWQYLRMNRGYIRASFCKVEEMGINILFSSGKEEANKLAYEILKGVYEPKRQKRIRDTKNTI